MEFLLILLFLGLLVGLVVREKGDNFFETLSSGCSTLFYLALILIAVAVLYAILD
jgi:hypothetical protein